MDQIEKLGYVKTSSPEEFITEREKLRKESKKVKKTKRKQEEIKIVKEKKLLTRVPVLFSQKKAGNNSCNRYYIFRISIIKSPKHFIKI